MEIKKHTLVVHMVIFAAVNLASCAGDSSQNHHLQAPYYAVAKGDAGWSVSCGIPDVAVDKSSLDKFYNSDRSTKSYKQFCDEYSPAP